MADHFFGAVEGGPIGELAEGDEVLFILLGDEAGGYLGEDEAGEPDEAEVEEDHRDAGAEEATDYPTVEVSGGVEEAVKAAEKPAQGGVEGAGKKVFFGAVGLEQDGAESG